MSIGFYRSLVKGIGTFVLAAVFVPPMVQDAAQMPAAAPAQSRRTGMIVGQVVDATSGAPVSEAIVRLAAPRYPADQPGAPNDRVMADSEGRFFFAELPPGDYYLQATKEGHTPGSYGQRVPWGQAQLLTLGDGERIADVQLRVWKYAVIGGTVVDEAGEPVVGTTVRALVREPFAGRMRYGNMQVIPELVPSATTDDRGIFRLPQLSPGTYVVLVPSTHATVPAGVLAKVDPTIRNELFRAGAHEISPPGQPRTVQLGDFALMTLSRVLIPPPPTPEGRLQVYPTTYYPAARTPAAAMPITVKAGDERTDLTLALRPVPAVRIAGRLVTPDGSPPPPMTLRLVGEAMADVISRIAASGPEHVGLETVTALSDSHGRFALLGVPAGNYVLQQANPFLIAAAREGRTAYWVSQSLTVGTEDISDLLVEVRPALRVEGRVELRRESGRPDSPPLPPPALMFETPFGEPGQFSAEIARDTLSFSTVVPGGQFIVRPAEFGGWFVNSVTLDAKDVTDRVFDLQGDATSLIVTFTDRPTKVSGSVTDERGALSASAAVLVFPTDRRRWSGHGANPRTLKSVLTTRTGLYTLEHVPAGEYYVIAVEASLADGWRDPERLEVLATHASRLSVSASESHKTLDLRMRPLQ